MLSSATPTITKATIGHHSGGIEQSVAGSFILSIFEVLCSEIPHMKRSVYHMLSSATPTIRQSGG
jgi:hypothetical protein